MLSKVPLVTPLPRTFHTTSADEKPARLVQLCKWAREVSSLQAQARVAGSAGQAALYLNNDLLSVNVTKAFAIHSLRSTVFHLLQPVNSNSETEHTMALKVRFSLSFVIRINDEAVC